MAYVSGSDHDLFEDPVVGIRAAERTNPLRSTRVWIRLGGSLGSGGPGMVVHSNAAGAEIVPDCDNIQSKDGCDQAAVCEDPNLCAPARGRS